MTPPRKQLTAELISNRHIQGDYFQADFRAPDFAPSRPGQFVHLQIPGLDGRILRRPFSLFDTPQEGGGFSLLYKTVGAGSLQLSHLTPGTQLDLLGPLGNGFSPITGEGATAHPALIAGGYGCAALYQLAKRAPASAKPLVLLGGRSQGDLLLQKEYATCGSSVAVSTDDGSAGFQGRVTELLEQEHAKSPITWVAACGPLPMLKALGQLMERLHIDGELSLDSAMCCGVGACFACVTKIKDSSSPEGWSYRRICHDGPIFPASQIYWEAKP